MGRKYEIAYVLVVIELRMISYVLESLALLFHFVMKLKIN